MPNQLSTKLCRLFDGGYCDISTFARLANTSPRAIEWLANRPGAKVDRDTEFRITKILAGFMRKYPELYWDVEPPEKRSAIVELETHCKSEKTFEVYDQSGEWRGTWVCPAQYAENDLDGIQAFLERHLTQKKALKLMRGGGSLLLALLPVLQSFPAS